MQRNAFSERLLDAHPTAYIDLNEGLANLNLEIEILKSRVGSMQSLINSQENTIVLFKIDLEEEKFRNTCLEREVRRLHIETVQ